MVRDSRQLSWVKAARKEFEKFPLGARREIEIALTLAAEGRKADTAKPVKGLGSGVFEIALAYRSDAYRVSMPSRLEKRYGSSMLSRRNLRPALKTPKAEINVIRTRLKRLKEMLR